ncbi:MAG: sugar nucleotide-binding protein [Nanoarchaeota archaeon]
MNKILITGASGRIGKGVLENLDYLFDSSAKIDLLQNKNPIQLGSSRHNCEIINNLSKNKYHFALHLAANADAAYCAKPENRAVVWEANVGLTGRVCDVADNVIFVSTDQVTGSTPLNEGLCEYDAPNPCSIYGKSKLDGEKVVLENEGNVVRIGTMLGVSNRLVDHAVEVILGRSKLEFFTNDYLRPTSLADFLETLKAVVASGAKQRIYHAECRGKIFSRYEIADRVLQECLERNLPVHVKEVIGCENENPRRLVLNTECTEKELALHFSDSEQALDKHIKKKIAQL